jgi:hypothetical protein
VEALRDTRVESVQTSTNTLCNNATGAGTFSERCVISSARYASETIPKKFADFGKSFSVFGTVRSALP